MENMLTIKILHNGVPLIFDAQLDTIGFVHKIHINVSGINVIFEPDEERNYRAIVPPAQIESLKESDKHIIAAIGAELDSISPVQITAAGKVSEA